MTIAVGFDGSDDSRRAARWAAALARSASPASLHLVHALGLPTIPALPIDIRVDELFDRQEREMREQLTTLERELGGAPLEIESFVRRWLPVETLLEHARDHGSELLVVGQHGSRPSRLLLGSVSSAVARSAEVPVVVVRGREAAAPPDAVLLAVDGSGFSRRAAEAVARWAPQARVVAVRIRDGSNGPERDEIARDLAAAGVDPAQVEIRIEDGAAAEILLALAETTTVDLIAAGRRGLSIWRELLLGSVSEKLLQLAPCPVLLAH